MTRHSTIYGQILDEARTKGSDHTIDAYSTAPFRARRDSLEVAWGVHIHRCKRKHSPSLICTKCQFPLTNTHILGGCRFTAKLRNATTMHSDYYSNTYISLMEDDGPYYARTWAINQSPTLATSWSTWILPHTYTIKAFHTQHKTGYKMTNQTTQPTHNPYPTMSYTHIIDSNITSQTSSEGWASPSTSKEN
jgi:hypothetical protein